MRYARPTCDECVRLAAEYRAIYQDYLDAKDALTLTQKNDQVFLEKRKHLDQLIGQLGEAMKRERLHESTHRDEFSN